MNTAILNPDILLTFNGINGASGAYLLPPIQPQQLVAIARGSVQDKDHLFDLQIRNRQTSQRFRGVKEGVDPKNPQTAGWGVIFAHRDRERIPGIRDALKELLDLRRSQAGERYKEFTGEDSYRPGETKSAFLARHGAGPGPVDPDKVPYYLLVIADPETIPFTFQYQLDVQYAVGRLYFRSLEEYAQYAHSVVAVETGKSGLSRQAVFFGVENNDDPATHLSSMHLIQPLAQKLAASLGQNAWQIQSITGEQATKEVLAHHLGGPCTPALIFTASHGMGFPAGDLRQLPHQGALLCQDWPGPRTWTQAIPEDFYFSADDIASDANLLGSVGFHFACYGAGTPQMDDFAHQAFRDPVAIAPQAFIASLPQRLLGHPRGGMLAAVSHVDRAWGYSFVWEKAASQLGVFESTLQRLMAEYPVGYAMEYFNERYAELSTELSSELQGARFGKEIDIVAMAGMWTANNDARSYVILGDPAVRLKFHQPGPIEALDAGLSGAAFSAISLPTKPVSDGRVLPGPPVTTDGASAPGAKTITPLDSPPLETFGLAEWSSLLSKPDDFRQEALFFRSLMASTAKPAITDVLELGCGGGNHAFHLKQFFHMSLVDASEDLLAASRTLNPDCDHLQGDMRTLRLGREFDAVVIHDAVAGLASLQELGQAIQTAYAHCRSGGVALFAADRTRESFRPTTDYGGHDGHQRAARFLKWIWDPDPSDSTYLVEFAYLLRDPDGTVRIAQDRRVCGLFSRQEWHDLIASAGFRTDAIASRRNIFNPNIAEIFVGIKD